MKDKHKKKLDEEKKAGEIVAENLNIEEKRKAAEFQLILEAIKADRKACVDLKCMNTPVDEVINDAVAQGVNDGGVIKKRNSK